MSASLVRLLRLRSIVEESVRMELERRAAFASRVEVAQQRERQSIRESRELAFETICAASSADQARQRSTEWTSAEAAAWRERQLAPLAEAASRRVDEGREDFFDRRKERRQVESVLDAEKARLRAESERCAQRELDDWFAMKPMRERNRRPRS